jgi:hypothetical protein
MFSAALVAIGLCSAGRSGRDHLPGEAFGDATARARPVGQDDLTA